MLENQDRRVHQYYRYFSFLCFLYFTLKSLIVPWSFYASSAPRMGLSDLGNNADFISNTAKGHFLFIEPFSMIHNHLTLTPLLFSPLTKIIESQFMYFAIQNFIASLCLAYFLIFVHKKLITIIEDKFQLYLSSLFFIFIFFANKYINSNFVSGHYELLAFSFMLLTYVFILEKKSLFRILFPFVLALGVREDVSFFFFFGFSSLFFIPKNLFSINKKHVSILMTICLVYLFLAVKVFLPMLGHGSWVSVFWGAWGNTWSEVFINCLTHPLKVLSICFLHSGFTNINETFFYLGIFSPIQWLLAQAPAVLFFLASDNEKRLLFWYNSSFILSGLYLSVFVGYIRLYLFISKFKYSKIIIVVLVFLFLSITFWKQNKIVNSIGYYFQMNDNKALFDKAFKEINNVCKQQSTYATDEIILSFLPNSKHKFLVGDWKKADIIIYSTFPLKSSYAPQLQAFKESVAKIESDKNLKMVYKDNIFTGYCKIN